MAQFAFNANSVQDDGKGDFSPLPNGDYPVVITASEEKTTNAGDGKGLNFEIEVIDGQYKGRKLFKWFNIENKNQQAVDIALREYKRLHDALGLVSTNATEELHNKPFIVRVDIDKKDADKNVIKGFKPYGSSAPAAAPANTTSFVKPSTPVAEKKPWE